MNIQPINFTGWYKISLPEIKSEEDRAALTNAMSHLGFKTSEFRVPNEPAKTSSIDNSMFVNIKDGFDNEYEEKVKSVLQDCNKKLKNEAVSKIYVGAASYYDLANAKSIDEVL